MAADLDRFPELLALIDRHWGFKQLRPLQERAMQAVLRRRDSLVVLPTGGGKSLCFQAPALLWPNEVTVIVSPLIALMRDQVDSLKAAGVSARHIDSSLTDAERVQTFHDLRGGKIRLLFVSPERMMMQSFQQFLQQLGVQTFAIDEAHCISHWGHDFRPEYRQLSSIRQIFPDAAFHGYTATATERVRADIVAQLGLRDPELLVGNFDRPNLTYRVVPRQRMLDQVVEVLKRHAGEAGIIYCIRRKDVDDLSADLRAVGYSVAPYHAGLSPDARKNAQEAFRAEKCDIVVATVAFGMGIDRSNVRFVLHTGMPKSIEHYQQEAGRAGRDGLEAECILLHSGADFMTWKRILQKSAEENQVDADFLPNSLAHLEEISNYSRGAVCRHRVLVEHFGQPFEPENCQACDMCLGEVEVEPESQNIARKILSCVARVKESFGVGQVVAILHGDDNEKITRYGHQNLTTYGLLKGSTPIQIRDWTHQLISMGLLEQTEADYPILKLNASSWEVMRNERRVQIRQTAARKSSRKSRTEEDSWEGVDRELCEELRKWRRETADARGWPPFAIFSDDTLREIARVRPSTLDNLRTVYGIGDVKRDAFGDDILRIVVPYCKEKGVSVNQTNSSPKRSSNESASPNADAYFPQFRKGASIEEVARSSGRTAGTVGKYLCAFIEKEPPASIDAWVAPELQKRIVEAAQKHGTAFLRPIFQELEEKVPYELIRVVLSFMVAG